MVAIGSRAAYSSAVGGAISVITTFYFAVHVFSAGIGTSPDTVAKTFYFGEAVKIGLSILLFAIAILWLDVSFLPLMLTYIATLAAYWLALPFSIDTVGKTR
jgi:ATP synthase protein I